MDKMAEEGDFFATFHDKKTNLGLGKFIRIVDATLHDLRIKFPEIYAELTMVHNDDHTSADVSSSVKKYNLRLLSFMSNCDKHPACKKYMRYLVVLYEYMNNNSAIISVDKTKMKTDFTNNYADSQTFELVLKVRNGFNNVCDFEPLVRIIRNMMHDKKQNKSLYCKYDNDRYRQKMINLLVYAHETEDGRRQNLKLRESLTNTVTLDCNTGDNYGDESTTKSKFEETIFKRILKSTCEISIQAELYAHLNCIDKSSYPVFLSFIT